MAIKCAIPYLLFNGSATKAIELYKEALGVKVEMLTYFKNMPKSETVPLRDEDLDRVMHARLSLDGMMLLVSDGSSNQKVTEHGNSMQVFLEFTDVEEMTQKFDALARGGKVTMPLSDTFWGARFGMLTDALGVRWMFSCERRKA